MVEVKNIAKQTSVEVLSVPELELSKVGRFSTKLYYVQFTLTSGSSGVVYPYLQSSWSLLNFNNQSPPLGLFG